MSGACGPTVGMSFPCPTAARNTRDARSVSCSLPSLTLFSFSPSSPSLPPSFVSVSALSKGLLGVASPRSGGSSRSVSCAGIFRRAACRAGADCGSSGL